MSEKMKSPKPKVIRTATWIDAELVRLAKLISASKGIKLQEVIEAALRGPLTRKAAKI